MVAMTFEEMLKKIYKHKFILTSSKKAIAQTERNELKYDLSDVVKEVLEKASGDMDLLITRTIDGYIMEVRNEILGLVPIELILKVRGIDYDIFGAEDEYLAKLEEQN
jgi:hypothetical protein